MKKLLSLLLALATVFAVCVAATSCSQSDSLDKAYNNYLASVKAPDDATETLTIATSPDFAPMEFYDLAKDQVVGFDILLANAIAKSLNKKLVIKPMGFDAVMTAVETGNADLGLSGFSWTPERAKSFNISDGYEAGDAASDQVLIVPKGKGATYTTAESFSGMKIGAQISSLQELLTNEQLVTKGAKLSSFAKVDDAVEALKTGKVDAVAVENGNSNAILSANPDLEKASFQFDVIDMYKYNVILINKSNDALLNSVNEILADLKAQGVFGEWYDACKVYSGVATADDLGFDDNGNKIKKETSAE